MPFITFCGVLLNTEILHDLMAIFIDENNFPKLLFKNQQGIRLQKSYSCTDIMNTLNFYLEKYPKEKFQDERIDKLEQKMDEIYYAPEMPGSIKASIAFHERLIS